MLQPSKGKLPKFSMQAQVTPRETVIRNLNPKLAVEPTVMVPPEATLGGLAADDEHHARLRDTLLVFLQSGGSYKATAEQMMLHKNTVQYRIRKAEESLGRPAAENRQDVELALQASRWLGSAVLQPPRDRSADTGASRR